jgi:membrane-associated protein
MVRENLIESEYINDCYSRFNRLHSTYRRALSRNYSTIWDLGVRNYFLHRLCRVVIMPFLPGDSLLFASGALSALGAFNLPTLIILFIAAAVLGDTLNYHIGKKVGTSISPNSFIGRFINQEKMDAAQKFFNKHGGKTIVAARFMPFIRTFIPFVAGASRMNYKYFISYNVIGGVLWVLICTFAGYFFGNIPIIKENFSTVILLIIFISVLPAIIGALRSRKK